MPFLKFGIIEQTVFFDSAPEDVYDALLDPEKHSAFTGSPATTSAKVGAAFTAWGGYIIGKNLELVKGKKIVQEWKTTEWPSGYPVSRLEFTLAPKKGGTELEMIHSKVPAEQLADYSSGWKSAYWDPLKEYLAERKTSATGKKRRAGSGSAHPSGVRHSERTDWPHRDEGRGCPRRQDYGRRVHGIDRPRHPQLQPLTPLRRRLARNHRRVHEIT